ncbi:MAG: UDP binding domain-containing protein, partial [Candidatus Neomarinimicrobiota bacterium]|nr:UDP binding domain-containing protein [Candidatus Neomarinimicrobiota bacterium]
PSLVLIESLIDKGAVVEYSDPYFKTIPHTRKYQFELESKALNAEILKSADLVLLATDHDDFDYELIEKEASLIVDTRGCFNYSNKVIKA